jgi:hypothetical protein
MRRKALGKRSRILLLSALAALTVAAAAAPHTRSPFGRLAKYEGRSADPITTVTVDVRAIVRARTLMRPGSTYLTQLPAGAAAAQLLHDLSGVTLLYLLPSTPVSDAAHADYVLAYHVAPQLPRGTQVRRRYDLGGGILLVQLQ